ncbi:DUF3817 domain-containing protein [Nocardioides jensenii]|uniref:DUF3817 domain-containing protein n=1 Tax=Nocardioides jensenii TaxID=1843 RepID=UPI00082FE160|nr:DUF3817 domain-containing protein [Nocardioides jensenii]
MSPLALFRRVAIAEAVTWALLLVGMFLKYVTETTELGVRIFGMVHGVVFVAYCLTTVVVWIDQKWTFGRLALGLVSAVPPFMTVWFDRHAEKAGALDSTWRLRAEQPTGQLEKPTAWVLRNPVAGALTGLVAVGVLTAVALTVGPPAS